MKKVKKKPVKSTAENFMEIVHLLKFDQSPAPTSRPLSNFTFWVGAGFSKSWNPKAPTGSELFNLNVNDIEDYASTTVASRLFGINKNIIDLDDIRSITYQIDMYERYPDICSRYMDKQNIKVLRNALRYAILKKYGELSRINYFDNITKKFSTVNFTADQAHIVRFFSYINECSDGSEGFSEGVRGHFVTTNYDFVIETILDNVLNVDDSMFLYTYRGITPVDIAGNENPVNAHHHWLSWHLIKLNGGFEIVRDFTGYRLNYLERDRQDIIRNPPIIMTPSREQDYSDPYFQEIFPKAVRLMRETKVLLLIGYSMPDDDALIRFIIRQFAEEPEDGFQKIIIYIDPMDKDTKISKIKKVFPSYDRNRPSLLTYEGTFSEFARDCEKYMRGPLI